MELKTIDRRSMAETSRFLQFKDPETGALMFDGDLPVGAWIKGSHARSVQAAIAAKQRAELADMEAGTRKALEDMQADLVYSAALLTTKIQGVTIGGLDLTPDQFPALYDATFLDADVALRRKTKRPGSFAQQVMAFANETSHFLTDA